MKIGLLKSGVILVLVLGLFFPALNNFYTHDDFYHFEMAQAESVGEVLKFFDLTEAPGGWGYYRPLTTQVVYFINQKVFNYSPLAMHGLAFLLFGLVVYLVYRLIEALTNKKEVAYLASLLYAASASHFSHLYSIANQELGHAIFFLSSNLFFIRYLKAKRKKDYGLAWLAFGGALLSKEFSVMLPVALMLVGIYLGLKKEWDFSFKGLFKLMLPFVGLLAIYGYLHVFKYGLIKGDSYIWVFSPKVAINSLAWYGLWSLNMPKMLVDFVGPGFKLNPNIFKFWGKEIGLILTLFSMLIVMLAVIAWQGLKKISRSEWLTYIFSLAWFGVMLLPVIFLPWHKFTTYLTIPLVGVVLSLSWLINKAGKKMNLWVLAWLIIYLLLSNRTLELTRRTDWITQGAETAKKVFSYLDENYPQLDKDLEIYFYDTEADQDLPWLPSDQLKLVLSDESFSRVFYEGKIKPHYVKSEEEITNLEAIKLPARQFFSY